MRMTLGAKKFGGFAPVTTVVTTTGSWQSVSIPVGATFARVRAIGHGGQGLTGKAGDYGGGGGAFAEKTAVNLSGLSAIAVLVGLRESNIRTDIRQNNSAGTLLASADYGRGTTNGFVGGSASSSTGDVTTSGQNGGINLGGAAAGPDGLGVSPAGASRSSLGTGNLYGGGSVGSNNAGQGWAEIYFT